MQQVPYWHDNGLLGFLPTGNLDLHLICTERAITLHTTPSCNLQVVNKCLLPETFRMVWGTSENSKAVHAIIKKMGNALGGSICLRKRRRWSEKNVSVSCTKC